MGVTMALYGLNIYGLSWKFTTFVELRSGKLSTRRLSCQENSNEQNSAILPNYFEILF